MYLFSLRRLRKLRVFEKGVQVDQYKYDSESYLFMLSFLVFEELDEEDC